MSNIENKAGDHAALMDSIYRGQRHIYDFTRKYYLFGRDRLIGQLACQPQDTVLEIACGTGRNLELIAKSWPGISLHGFDISGEMLKSAQARLQGRAILAQGDARNFDCASMFGCDGFDRIVLSYSLSMIPDWETALAAAIKALAPNGSLHIVDFGDLRTMPHLAAAGLRAWLGKFHVAPRENLSAIAEELAKKYSCSITVEHGPMRYFQILTICRSAPQ